MGREGGGVPRLSLIICSRNDAYMGNALYRLQTTLNYAARRISAADRLADVEIVVSDWGSEQALRTVLALCPEARRIVRFVEVPPATALARQKDSPFAEVLALNAVIRRSRGEHIGRIDQDTLVGAGFIEAFFEALEGRTSWSAHPSRAVLFSPRRCIAQGLVRREPSVDSLELFLERYGSLLPVEGTFIEPWFDRPVGIFAAHRSLWEEAKGYDERLLYWGFMEADLAWRLSAKVPILDLESEIGLHFYHQEHTATWRRGNHRRRNPRAQPRSLEVNDSDWGLAAEDLPVLEAGTPAPPAHGEPSAPLRSELFLRLRGPEWLLRAWLRVFAPRWALAMARALGLRKGESGEILLPHAARKLVGFVRAVAVLLARWIPMNRRRVE